MNWYAKSRDGVHNQGLVIDEDTGVNIAVVYDNKHTRLIAAAPDLFKQLKDAARMLNYLAPEKFDDEEHEVNWTRMLEGIDAAIAKV